MAKVTEISNFKQGTTKEAVEAIKIMRLSQGAETCTYVGSVSNGWKMTTVWNVPD